MRANYRVNNEAHYLYPRSGLHRQLKAFREKVIKDASAEKSSRILSRFKKQSPLVSALYFKTLLVPGSGHVLQALGFIIGISLSVLSIVGIVDPTLLPETIQDCFRDIFINFTEAYSHYLPPNKPWASELLESFTYICPVILYICLLAAFNTLSRRNAKLERVRISTEFDILISLGTQGMEECKARIIEDDASSGDDIMAELDLLLRQTSQGRPCEFFTANDGEITVVFQVEIGDTEYTLGQQGTWDSWAQTQVTTVEALALATDDETCLACALLREMPQQLERFRDNYEYFRDECYKLTSLDISQGFKEEGPKMLLTVDDSEVIYRALASIKKEGRPKSLALQANEGSGKTVILDKIGEVLKGLYLTPDTMVEHAYGLKYVSAFLIDDVDRLCQEPGKRDVVALMVKLSKDRGIPIIATCENASALPDKLLEHFELKLTLTPKTLPQLLKISGLSQFDGIEKYRDILARVASLTAAEASALGKRFSSKSTLNETEFIVTLEEIRQSA